MRKNVLCLFSAIFFLVSSSPAQKKIVVIGSSTCFGIGATSGNGWVDLYQSYLQGLNANNTVINLCYTGGYTTGQVMPTGTGGEDPDRNITKAISYNPNAIIVNLPSNDTENNTPEDVILARYAIIKGAADAAGIPIWFTTTQPRNTSEVKRLALISLRDATIATYPNTYIDFWTTVANADGTINSTYNSDGVHLNNVGHNILFHRTEEKNILGFSVLPVSFTSLQATQKSKTVEIKWEVGLQSDVLRYEIEKSSDGISFSKIAGINSSSITNYNFIDLNPSVGKNFYRIKAVFVGGVPSYSKIVFINLAGTKRLLTANPNPAVNNQFNLQLPELQQGNYTLNVFTNTSQKVFSKSFYHFGSTASQTIDLSSLKLKGMLFLQVTSEKQKYSQVIPIILL
jgi:lysophospholipase L1-like esterase